MDKTQLLIQDIERKDRRFRFAQSIFGILVIVLTSASIFIALQTLRNVQEQQTQLARAVEELKQSNSTGLQKANAHLDCIALFFTQIDRANKTLDGCDIMPSPTAPSTVAPEAPTVVNSKPVTVTPSATPQPTQTPVPQSSFAKFVQEIINNIMRIFQ